LTKISLNDILILLIKLVILSGRAGFFIKKEKMRVSSQKINQKVEKEALSLLYQVIADTRRVDETEKLLKGLLSEAELFSIAKRIAVAKYLKEGLSYTEIKKKLKVSSATVSQIQSQIQTDPGFQIVLEKIETEQWAEKWEKKIKEIFGK
jgi:uncharacterized protein YerC